MPTTNQGASYVQLPNGQFVSAGKAASIAKANSQPVAGLRTELQRDIPQTLDGHAPKQTKRSKGAAICIILIVRFGPRELDDDNLAASYKSCRDLLAAELGIDDGDKRLQWHYRQVNSPGIRGTGIVISVR